MTSVAAGDSGGVVVSGGKKMTAGPICWSVGGTFTGTRGESDASALFDTMNFASPSLFLSSKGGGDGKSPSVAIDLLHTYYFPLLLSRAYKRLCIKSTSLATPTTPPAAISAISFAATITTEKCDVIHLSLTFASSPPLSHSFLLSHVN